MKPPPERYEAHIFRWWMHHHFKDEEDKPMPNTRFENACLAGYISETQGKRIVSYYLKRFKAAYHVDYDMGRDPAAELVEVHCQYKEQRRPGCRDKVFAVMKLWHDDAELRRAVQGKLVRPASPFVRPRPHLGDLLSRRR